jgi:hypothetical protein
VYQAVEFIGIAIAFCSVGYFLYSLALVLFAGGRRQSGAKGMGFSLIVFLVAGLLFSVERSGIATQEGFTSIADYEVAREKELSLKAAQEELDERKAKETCAKDLQCIFKEHELLILPQCKRSIERSAKYQFKWTGGALTPYFKRIAWKNEKKGVVSFIGDSISFQNGFGAWSNMIYFCDYSTLENAIVGISIDEGRL